MLQPRYILDDYILNTNQVFVNLCSSFGVPILANPINWVLLIFPSGAINEIHHRVPFGDLQLEPSREPQP